MFLIFFLLWVIFNGRITVEIAVIGLLVAGTVYWFMCRFMGLSPKTELLYLRKGGYLLRYLFCLIREIVTANVTAMRLVLSAREQVEPCIVQFETDLASGFSRFLLANSITLTPGTITVAVEGNRFTVHCLDRSLSEGLEECVFVKLLRRMEQVC